MVWYSGGGPTGAACAGPRAPPVSPALSPESWGGSSPAFWVVSSFVGVYAGGGPCGASYLGLRIPA